jgi:hypothetical protein
MTIVVYRDGIMAADSAMNYDQLKVGSIQKVFWLDNGAMYGGAGQVDDRDIRAFLGSKPFPCELDALQLIDMCTCDLQSILVMRDGRTFQVFVDLWEGKKDDTAEIIEIKAEYAAVGVGWQMAIGALAAGADAERTVELVAKHADTVQLPVQTLKLIDSPKPKRRRRKKTGEADGEES